ncbi:MAG: hypothetical protein LBB63_01100 [Holosporaceae bacterium]|nr:hypothetical protein [Holosporaceae bacterium]
MKKGILSLAVCALLLGAVDCHGALLSRPADINNVNEVAIAIRTIRATATTATSTSDAKVALSGACSLYGQLCCNDPAVASKPGWVLSVINTLQKAGLPKTGTGATSGYLALVRTASRRPPEDHSDFYRVISNQAIVNFNDIINNQTPPDDIKAEGFDDITTNGNSQMQQGDDTAKIVASCETVLGWCEGLLNRKIPNANNLGSGGSSNDSHNSVDNNDDNDDESAGSSSGADKKSKRCNIM